MNYDERTVWEFSKGSFWDFTKLSVVDNDSKAMSRLDGNIYFESLDETCRAYVLRGDTLFFRGYNIGRGEHVLANDFLPLTHLPQKIGTSLVNNYIGKGLYYVDLQIMEQGTHTAQSIDRGRAMILPGDTIKNVFLIKEIFDLHREISPDGKPFCVDTIPMQQTVIYRWMYQNEITPIAVQIEQYTENSDGGMQQLSKRMFVCRSFSIESDESQNDADIPDDNYILQTLQSAEIQTNNNEIAISFNPISTEFGIDIYLLDLTGNIYAQTSLSLTQNEPNSAILNTSTVPQGSYIVAICYSENPELNYKIAITI